MDLRKHRRAAFIFLTLVVAFIFLYHGVPKALSPTNAMAKFVGMGFPGFLGPIIGWLEVLAGLALIFGIWHTGANLILAVIIAVALVFVKAPNGIAEGLERDLLILAATLLLAAEGNWHHPLKKK